MGAPEQSLGAGPSLRLGVCKTLQPSQRKAGGGRVGAVGGGGVGWGDRLSYARIPREAASSLPPLLCAPSPPTPDGEGIPKPGCWEEWPPPLPMPAGSSPRSCALGAQGGVGTEPRAPAHWPSSNLPGDDRLRYENKDEDP